MTTSTRAALRLPVEQPFELRLALFGHGWIDLPPHTFDHDHGRFATALEIDRSPVDVTVTQTAANLSVRVDGNRLTAAVRARARDQIRWMLRLDDHLEPFWATCRAIPRLCWVAERGGGRLLRSATVFEDLMKLLFTTNCSWAATRSMTRRLVDALGQPAPSGRRAFPTAAACAAQPLAFWRNAVRAGYRDVACHELAERFATGQFHDALFTDAALSTDELRARLLALRGFGPYAAGQAMRLLGRHDDLALDSWCRNRLAQLRGRRRPPSDRTIEREYRSFGAFKGLALWMDLTEEWHRQPPPPTVLSIPLR